MSSKSVSFVKNIVYEKLMDNIERFNRMVKAKGKTLSLNFTVQQENWPELPAFIRFCNEREASVYVSYLDSPKAYTISELSKAELQRIVVTLSKETFPLDTALHRHNAQCLQDFLTYTNKHITSEQEAQYEDYLYLPDSLTDIQKEQMRGKKLFAFQKQPLEMK
jgi:MoaA/NifB/PqqE/SkfB family radical SAM enzyme